MNRKSTHKPNHQTKNQPITQTLSQQHKQPTSFQDPNPVVAEGLKPDERDLTNKSLYIYIYMVFEKVKMREI